jgi:hypothetical protein
MRKDASELQDEAQSSSAAIKDDAEEQFEDFQSEVRETSESSRTDY